MHLFRITPVALAATIVIAGCGTTRSSDTQRTATEQLLISDAIDRAVEELNVSNLAGQSVYFEDKYLQSVVDRQYLISTLRQHLLAHGCVLKHKRDEADFVVEARAGAIGTNRHDLLFGIPSMNLPQIFPLQGVPAAIPEVPVAKRRDQRGVAKVAVYAYHRETGLPVWQSGIAQKESSLNDVWLLGAGPFQHGTIQNGPRFANKELAAKHPNRAHRRAGQKAVGLAQEASFADAARLAAGPQRLPQVSREVKLASHEESMTNPPKPAPPQPASAGETVDAPIDLDLSRPQPKPTGDVYLRIEHKTLSPTIPTAPQAIAVPDGADLIPLPQPIVDTPR